MSTHPWTSTRNPNLELDRLAHPLDPKDPLVGPRREGWWTGASPVRPGCPGLDRAGVLRSLQMPHLLACSRREVADYFANTWALTELLFSSLQGRDAFLTPPYHRLRHPLIFYYCHPATLYVNKLRIAGLIKAIRPDFETLFQTGVDEMSWDDLSQADLEWPEVAEVTDYRREVFRRVRDVIEQHPDLADGHRPITQAHELWALFMSFEHERIHLETSSVLIRELPVEWVRRPPQWAPLHPTATRQQSASPAEGHDFPRNELIDVAGGPVRIGKPREWPSFGWDNEYGERTVDVAPFRVQKFLVSNGDFLEFVKAEGYLDPAWWTRDGWGWRQFRNAKWPTFWVSAGPAGLHEYRLRTLFEIVELPWSWPVEVNCHEARAYCTWRQRRDGTRYRLLSEAKHHCLRSPNGEHAGGVPVDPATQNSNLAFGSAGPVDQFPPSPTGVHDLFGNVWQWAEDHFHPLDGFRVHPLYDDFSTPCFDGKHQMILGGSFVSTGDKASVWARFHFRPHFFQHAGFRLVETRHGTTDVVRLDAARPANVYEQDAALREYLALHYGGREDSMPFELGPRDATQFPSRCAELAIELACSLRIQTDRALDVGCAVGRTSFELTRAFREVLGVDLSERFIRAANQLRETGRLRYFLREEGEIGEDREAVVSPDLDRRGVQFRAADACALPAELVGFDLVLAANLLCRLPSPGAFLARLGGYRGLVRPGGLLFLTTPGTWSETFTPKESWLGGRQEGDLALRTFDGLREALGDEFELVVQEDMPLLIREHRRKYQYIVTHMSAWRRNERAG